MSQIIYIIFLLLVIAVFVLVWQGHDLILQYLFFLRIPGLMGLFLFALPFIAVFGLPSMLKNLFVLRTKEQLALVIAAAIVAGMAVVLVTAVVLGNAPARFGIPVWLQLPRDWFSFYTLLLPFSLPISIAATYLSWREQELKIKECIIGCVLGTVSAVGLLYLINVATDLIKSSDGFRTVILALLSWFPDVVKRGYLNSQGDGLTDGHLAALGYLVVVAIVYIGGFFLLNPYKKLKSEQKPQNQPKNHQNEFEVPALFYLLVIILSIVLFLGGLAFSLDYFRIPVLGSLVVISLLTYSRFNVDHFYKLKDDEINGESVDLGEALNKRLDNQGEERTLVVVCASGGGIQASGWTVRVLTGLQQVLGSDFIRAIGLISSVSGGSVGTMFYLDRFDDNNDYPQKNELDDIFESATKDCLDATGWGLAYPDLWRAIGFPYLADNYVVRKLVVDDFVDRGTAIEADWKAEMKNPNTSLATWRKKIQEGKIPIPVFNATLVENGNRFLISPLAFKGFDGKYEDFKTLYPKKDIDATTAARLSATFPYVSPVCRNSEGEHIYHVADGGFFDNFGVFTSIEWLKNCILPHRQELKIKRVLLLEINAFSEPVQKVNNSAKQGWIMTALGPLLALLNVRSSTQTVRNAADVSYFKQVWEKAEDVEIANFSIQFPDPKEIRKKMKEKPRDGLTSPLANTEGNYAPPLSWKLTQLEKEAIKVAWDMVEQNGVIPEIKKKWNEWHSHRSS